MFKRIGSATALFVIGIVPALVHVTPAVAQISLYRMDFSPDQFDPNSPGLVEGELNIGPNNYALPGFGWDETHGQQARPGVYYPAVAGQDPETPNNRAFVFMFGTVGQTSSTFTSTTTPGSTFPAGGIDPTDMDNEGLGITWAQHLEATNGSNFPVHVRPAVQIAGGNWYVSNAVFDTGTVGQGAQGNYDPQTLIYNPAAANWLNLTIGETAAEGVTIGAQPGASLSGNITGLGFVAAFDIQSTVHIDYVDIGIPPVPGDVNGDRIVDLAIDFATIKANFGQQVADRTFGDVTGDGVVDLFDFAQWKGNYPFPGAGGGGISLAGQGTVPEPASAVLIVLGLSCALGVRRFRIKCSA